MTIFEATLIVLSATVLVIWRLTCTVSSKIDNKDFIRLQRRYLLVYCGAAFSDWLQGPYLYKLYSEYGYDCGAIAILYVAGILSSSVFGVALGLIADRYTRRLVCASYGLFYGMCCLLATSEKFHDLFLGRIFGGIATSILFSVFESWYLNEHLNWYKFPPEWLNLTFGKCGFYTGFLAIIAGIVSQILVERLQLGPISPFLLALPFLMLSTYLIMTTWEEHNTLLLDEDKPDITSTLHLIFSKEPILLLLCFVQSLYEAVIYVFIFSWSPLISSVDPPLGLIFSTFMLSFMIGSKLYSILVTNRYGAPQILTATCFIGLLSFSAATIVLLVALLDIHIINNNFKTPYILYYCFICYEVSIGLFFPAVGYLRGRIVPEKFRASVINWFRVPMNMFTCIILLFQHIYCQTSGETLPVYLNDRNKFAVVYIACSMMLLVATGISYAFGKLYYSKFSEANNGKFYGSITDDSESLVGVQKDGIT